MYSCSVCGSTALVLVAMPMVEGREASWWSVRCGNGHPYIAVPGTELIIEFTIDATE